MASERVAVIFYREGARWLAQSVSPEVATFGDSLDEARAASREALELYFEAEPQELESLAK